MVTQTASCSAHSAMRVFGTLLASQALCGAQSAQRKMLDVLNSVGLSDRLLRLVDRRQRMDKWIVYGGMLFTVLLLGGLVWWLR